MKLEREVPQRRRRHDPDQTFYDKYFAWLESLPALVVITILACVAVVVTVKFSLTKDRPQKVQTDCADGYVGLIDVFGHYSCRSERNGWPHAAETPTSVTYGSRITGTSGSFTESTTISFCNNGRMLNLASDGYWICGPSNTTTLCVDSYDSLSGRSTTTCQETSP